ncbi:right-handed parallel beta-helix repeat-containing protein [Luteolibacter sp. Populi]|uniref:right-handed parallel beta-helix repeat-containing protein n=1 Tax=Luteolibacter sp. Populi TaxID=3230487 RepID=UPI003466D2AB
MSIPASWYGGQHPPRPGSGFYFSRIDHGNLFIYPPGYGYAIGSKFGGNSERTATSRSGTQWANIGLIKVPNYPANRYQQGQTIVATYKCQDRDSQMRVEWYLDNDENPSNAGSSAIASQLLESTGDKVNEGSVNISTVGLSSGITRRLLAKVTSLGGDSNVRYEYADNSITITPADFVLNFSTPDTVMTNAGMTVVTLQGAGFGPTDRVLFSNGTTTTPVTPSSVPNGNQIVASFDFGSVAGTWTVAVGKYVNGTMSRSSDPLEIVVSSSAPAGPAIVAASPADVTVTSGQTGIFTVSASGSGSLAYQWYRNGIAIAGATSASYTTSPVTPDVSGYTYHVLVTDDNGTRTSRTAVLTVVPPTIGVSDPAEPNDRSTQATPLTLEQAASGLIASPFDIDWYQVTMAAAGQLNLSLVVPSGMDYDLEFYGPDGAWLAGSYKMAGENETIQRSVGAGYYYVRVYGYPVGQGAYSTSLPYQLTTSTSVEQPPGPLAGPITSSVMWSGTVEVSGDVTIAAGGSLTILPGTQVRCATGDGETSGVDSNRVEIIVDGGTLVANGTADAPIRFGSMLTSPTAGAWFGIRVKSGDVSLVNCTVEFASQGLRFESTDTRFSSYELSGVTVQRCGGNGVWTTSGQYALPVMLEGFRLIGNGTGLRAEGPVTMQGGEIRNSTSYGVNANTVLVMEGTEVKLSGNTGINNSQGSTTLTDCEISYSQGNGVESGLGTLRINGCSIAHNSRWGVYGYWWSYNVAGRTAELEDNTVQDNAEGGIVLYSSATVGVAGNTVSGNGGPGLLLSLEGNYGPAGVSATGITGNTIRNNGGAGVVVQGNQPPVLTISGNDIHLNTGFEIRNEGSSTVVANGNYWGEPTAGELHASVVNLSRVYDLRDGGATRAVMITQWYEASVAGGSPGSLQSYSYPVPGVTQTVSGTISTAQSWSGKVLVTGDVTITGSLTIQAGTEVVFDHLHDGRAAGSDSSRCELILDGGTLEVNGMAASPVTFTSTATAKSPGDWYGIRVKNGDISLENCTVEFASQGIRFESTDTRFSSYALSGVTVQRCSGNGVWTTSGQYALPVLLDDFTLIGNGTGLRAEGPVTMQGGEIRNSTSYGVNATTLLVMEGTEVKLSGNTGINNSQGSTTLTDCEISYSQGNGVESGLGTLRMEGCRIAHNSRWGVYGYWWNYNVAGRTAELEDNTVQDNAEGGIVLYSSATVGVAGNTVSGNGGPGLLLSLEGNYGPAGVSATGITGNTIRSNGGAGVVVQGNQPPVLALAGNDIHLNTGFEIRNESGISIVANNCYWGEPTASEIATNQVNLSRIYDRSDNAAYGQVLIETMSWPPNFGHELAKLSYGGRLRESLG